MVKKKSEGKNNKFKKELLFVFTFPHSQFQGYNELSVHLEVKNKNADQEADT